jgi:hypothetical protein
VPRRQQRWSSSGAGGFRGHGCSEGAGAVGRHRVAWGVLWQKREIKIVKTWLKHGKTQQKKNNKLRLNQQKMKVE